MKIGKEEKEQIRKVGRKLKEYLAGKDFVQVRRQFTGSGFCFLYRWNSLYIKFSGSCHPMDYPYDANLILGDGSDEYPHSDTHGVALWAIRRMKNDPDAVEYTFEEVFRDDFVARLICELEEFANEFLVNKDVSLIYQAIRKRDETLQEGSGE